MMQSVWIQVYIDDKPEPKYRDWKLAVWDYTTDRLVWGLTWEDEPTHMCYSLKESPPLPAIKRRREKFKENADTNWLYWFFDVGYKLRVTLADLENALWKLGIRDEATETL